MKKAEIQEFLMKLNKRKLSNLIVGIITSQEYTKEDKMILDLLKDHRLDKIAEAVLWNFVSRSDNALTLKYGSIFCCREG